MLDLYPVYADDAGDVVYSSTTQDMPPTNQCLARCHMTVRNHSPRNPQRAHAAVQEVAGRLNDIAALSGVVQRSLERQEIGSDEITMLRQGVASLPQPSRQAAPLQLALVLLLQVDHATK